MINDNHLEQIAARLDQLKKIPVITAVMEAGLSLLDRRSSRSGLLGSVEAGLFQTNR